MRKLCICLLIFVTMPVYAHYWDANVPLLHDQKSRSDDLWDHLRRDFQLHSAYKHPNVQKQIKYLLKHKQYLNKLFRQTAPYLYFVYHRVKDNHLPGELALLPIIESGYDPFAYSKAGAAGLWQLMPGTGTGLGLKQNWWYDGRRDVYASTHAALRYLKYLRDFFHNRWLLAIAAYDSGEGTVQNSIRRNSSKGKNTDFWSLPLPRETRSYLPRLLALAAIIDRPSHYGVTLPRVIDEPYFDQVEVGRQVDLSQVAKLAGIDQTELYRLNPGFNRWATDPNGPYSLVLPIDKIQDFRDNIAGLSDDSKVTWRYYIVKKNDSIGGISNRFHTTSALLKAVNKLKGKYLKPGTELLIPETAHSIKHAQIGPRRHVMTSKIQKLGPHRYQHMVHQHESLEQIGKIYKVKPAAIRFWNRIKGKHLSPGQTLIVYSHRTKRQVSRAKFHTYKIRPGDTLSGIAHRNHIRVKQLLHYNPKVDSRHLKIGQTVVIPPSYL